MRATAVAVLTSLSLTVWSMADAAAGPRAVRAVALPTSVTWPDGQFVQADQKGRLFVLRADPLSVYPLERNGTLGNPRALQVQSGLHVGPAMAAAMSPDGSQWLLLCFGGSEPLRWFVFGEEKVVPKLDRAPVAVSFVGSTPVVAVGSFVGSRLPSPGDGNPALLALDGDKWRPLLVREVDWTTYAEQGPTWLNAVRQLLITPAMKGDRLWVAGEHQYLVEQVDSSGKRLVSFSVGETEVELVRRDVAEVSKKRSELAEAQAAGQHVPPQMTTDAHFSRPVAKPLLQAVAERPGGVLYLLGGKGAAAGGETLDRYDPVERKLERVQVALPPFSGRRSMAAGMDGLVIANFGGSKGRWLVPWEELENASWQPVEDVEELSLRR